MFQKLNGDPEPEHRWPSEDDWKRRYPRLFPDSSSGLEDGQEQVGYRNKVKRRHSFYMSFVFEVHFSSLLAWDHALSLLSLYVFFFLSSALEKKKKKKKKKKLLIAG